VKVSFSRDQPQFQVLCAVLQTGILFHVSSVIIHA
jgi:hypothetical protein